MVCLIVLLHIVVIENVFVVMLLCIVCVINLPLMKVAFNDFIDCSVHD